MKRALLSAIILLGAAGGAAGQGSVPPNWVASGVAPVTSSISSASVSSSFVSAAGRPFHVQLTGTAVATCYLERQLDGTNWVPIAVAAGGGAPIYLHQYVYSSATLTEDVTEYQTAVPYRLDCGVLLGSYSSGTLSVRFSQ